MRSAILSAAVLLAACGDLNLVPGAEVKVFWSPDAPYEVTQALDAVPLDFKVEGCDAFAASVEVGTDETGMRSTPVEVSKTATGWRALAAPNALRLEMNCGFPQSQSTPVRIAIICNVDQRRSVSVDRPIHVTVAANYSPVFGSIRGVVAAVEWQGTYWYADDEIGLETPGGSSRVMFGSTRIDATLGVKNFNNGVVTVTREPENGMLNLPDGRTVEVAGVKAQVFRSRLSSLSTIWLPVTPNYRFQLVDVGEPSALMLVSQVVRSDRGASLIVVSRVDFNGAEGKEVAVKAVLEAPEALITVLGTSSILTYADHALHVRNFELTTDAIRGFTPPIGRWAEVLTTTPDGRFFAYARGNSVYVDEVSPATSFELLLGKQDLEIDRLQYLSNGSLAIIADGQVTVIDAAANKTVLSLTVPGKAENHAMRVLPLEAGAFAVVTESGIQLFDASLKRQGGADPLAPECSQALSESMVSVMGPKSVAVGGKVGIFTFKLP